MNQVELEQSIHIFICLWRENTESNVRFSPNFIIWKCKDDINHQIMTKITLVECPEGLVFKSRFPFQKLDFFVWTMRSCFEISPASSDKLENSSNSSSSIFEYQQSQIKVYSLSLPSHHLPRGSQQNPWVSPVFANVKNCSTTVITYPAISVVIRLVKNLLESLLCSASRCLFHYWHHFQNLK